MTALALEIGAEEFVAGVVSRDAGSIECFRVPIPARGAWDACEELLHHAAATTDVDSLGIACAGPIDMTAGVVAPDSVTEWRMGFGLVEAASKVFPLAAVRMALDGVCLAMAEHGFGATRAVLDSLAINASNRVAGGVMVGGFTIVGRTGNAGNVGHVLVQGFDEPCLCGGRGCLEAIAGGLSVLRWAQAQGWQGTSVAAVVEAAQSGDEIATAALGRAGTALGRVVASMSALLDIDTVVIGGTLAGAGNVLWQPLGAAVTAHARLGYQSGLRVVPSPLGDVGVLAGAGLLAVAAQG